ncbi:MAG: hypothetical protein JWP92_3226 [Caulobacter sp.]|nr:hypothetical protein [Caulobacter sp.]
MMRALPLVLGAAIALSSCAAVNQASAPICDGKHRRPANPYGSVLDPASPPASSPATPAPATPKALSALAASYRRCA